MKEPLKRGTNNRQKPETQAQHTWKIIKIILATPVIFFLIYSTIYVFLAYTWQMVAFVAFLSFVGTRKFW